MPLIRELRDNLRVSLKLSNGESAGAIQRLSGVKRVRAFLDTLQAHRDSRAGTRLSVL